MRRTTAASCPLALALFRSLKEKKKISSGDMVRALQQHPRSSLAVFWTAARFPDKRPLLDPVVLVEAAEAIQKTKNTDYANRIVHFSFSNGITPPVRFFHLILDTFAQGRELESAKEVWRRIKESELEKDIQMQKLMLKNYLNVLGVSPVVKHLMKGTFLGMKIHSDLIVFFIQELARFEFRNVSHQEIDFVFDLPIESQFKSAAYFETLLQLCIQTRYIEKIHHVIKLMSSHGIHPTEHQVLTAIRVLSSIPNQSDQVSILLNDMWKSGILPSPPMFEEAMEYFVKESKYDKCYKLGIGLLDLNMVSSPKGFYCVINSCMKLALPEKAVEVFQHMDDLKIRPSPECYDVLVDGLIVE
jgi:pentatricopeptide repeat protein